MHHSTLAYLSHAVLSLAPCASGQAFGPQQVITTSADGAWSVYAADLDGDGDMDVTYASRQDNTVAWSENLGSGTLGPKQVVDSAVVGASFVRSADVDGDGDLDLVSTSTFGDAVSWHENLLVGSGVVSFASPRLINSPTLSGCCGAYGLDLADLDSDGDIDALVAFDSTGEFTWFENVGMGNGAGGGAFAAKQVIATASCSATYIHAADVDDDDEIDVVFSDTACDLIRWSQNQGSEVFAPPLDITNAADSPHDIHATDLDGDGDLDLVSGSRLDDKVAWYENIGGGGFGPQQVIGADAKGCVSVFATDLDGDGDADILAASETDNTIAWYENLGNGTFGPEQVITTSAAGARFVYAADLDGDGDADVLSASYDDDKIAWFENLTPLIDCNQNGVQDFSDIASGTSVDCDGDGIPDECNISAISSLDQNLNGALDSCECLVSNYCTSTPNTTNQPALMGVLGIPSLSMNNFVLRAGHLPLGEPGIFYFGPLALDPPLTFGDGYRCVGGNTVRLYPPLLVSGTGSVSRQLDFTQAPTNGFVSGQTAHFQFWYRDHPAVGAGWNLSDALQVTFCP